MGCIGLRAMSLGGVGQGAGVKRVPTVDKREERTVARQGIAAFEKALNRAA